MGIDVAAEKRAYKKFIAAGMTPAGACGLIGNLEAESDGFIPSKVEYLCIQRLREAGKSYCTQESYNKALDEGRISCEEFLHPLPGKQYGYGLAQWTTPARKSGLWSLAHQKGVKLSDEDMQLEYLLQELRTGYPSVMQVLTTATSIRTASDVVLKRFEAPANTGEAVCQSRAARGQRFYENYAKEAQSMGHGQAAVDLALSRRGKNQYTQTYLREQVFNGWSDCSSLVWKCFERAYGIYVGSWTGEQVKCGRQIIKRSSAVAYAKITQAEVNKLQPGDCLFYGSGDAYHVEMYIGNGQQIGHGSGVGPTIKNCLEYAHSHGFYQARRYVADDIEGTVPATKWKATGTATSTGDDVKVRATPGGAVLRSVNKGNRFEIDGQVSNGWVHVNVAGTVGYIYEQYVQLDKVDTAQPADSFRLFVGEVTADELNVRSWYGNDGNGQYYPQIKAYPVLKKGNLVDVLVEYKYGSGTWYKVRIAGKYIGFVSGAYIKRQ